MNDLMPPERRPMPGDRSQIMRTFLQDESKPVRPPHRRRSLPVLAAAAAAVIAVGGYVIATEVGGDDNGVNEQPSGQLGGDQNDQSNQGQNQHPDQQSQDAGGDPALNQLTDGSGPPDAGQRCIDAIEQEYKRRGEPQPGPDPEVRLINEAVESTTVVASNGTRVWTCNVDPDRAVSYDVPDSTPVPSADAFDFAANDTRNYNLGPGTLAWAGGPAPEGVDSIRYVFADGGAAEAVVQDGYWAMQYLTDKGDPAPHGSWVSVLLDGPGGERTVRIHVGVGKFPFSPCNQMSHGC